MVPGGQDQVSPRHEVRRQRLASDARPRGLPGPAPSSSRATPASRASPPIEPRSPISSGVPATASSSSRSADADRQMLAVHTYRIRTRPPRSTRLRIARYSVGSPAPTIPPLTSPPPQRPRRRRSHPSPDAHSSGLVPLAVHRFARGPSRFARHHAGWTLRLAMLPGPLRRHPSLPPTRPAGGHRGHAPLGRTIRRNHSAHPRGLRRRWAGPRQRPAPADSPSLCSCATRLPRRLPSRPPTSPHSGSRTR